jgi:type I restriction enzyme S subunit
MWTEAPAAWRIERLDDMCLAVTSGGTPSRRQSARYYTASGHPWVKTKELHDQRITSTEECITDYGLAESSAKLLPKNTVLVAMYGATVGMLGVLDMPAACNQACAALIVDSTRADHRFVFYSLLAHRRELQSLAVGSAQQNLSGQAVKRFPIPVPPLAEQNAIADILGALDDKIESNRRLAGRYDATWACYVTHALRGAEIVPVQELLDDGILVVNDGYRAKNSELAAEGIAFVRAGNLTDHGLDLTGADRVPADLAARVGNKRSMAWDTAFTSKGTVGRITLVDPDAQTFVYSPQVCFWRSLDAERLSPFVLHAWMRSGRFNEQIDAVKGQTDMADYVSLRDQRAMRFNLPTPTAQATAAGFAEPLARAASAARREARTLSAIRDALLPKVVSGQIRIPVADDVEEGVGAAIEALA